MPASMAVGVWGAGDMMLMHVLLLVRQGSWWFSSPQLLELATTMHKESCPEAPANSCDAGEVFAFKPLRHRSMGDLLYESNSPKGSRSPSFATQAGHSGRSGIGAQVAPSLS